MAELLRRARNARVAALVAALAAGALSVAGYNTLFPHTTFGRCLALTQRCNHVPLETLELASGLAWADPDARVLQSSASLPGTVGLNGGPAYVSGLIEVHGAGEPVIRGDGYTAAETNSSLALLTDNGRRALNNADATDISVLRRRGNLVALEGHKGNSTIVYIYSIIKQG
ncbi:hypothetical protein [Curtobacterium sp. MCBD17_040]|uniref:hypothetical protein n=1 Tax=Curtobacterium sp. MCBD17_040 TaxID=2175674 RepID=UPI0011B7CED9|nr:hypothetical protein [Curtobacterium sp. MCBD17_040]WIB65516.1 hypothetical protein DEI94_19270 [Curtobacterium sp. MCBD17_040]